MFSHQNSVRLPIKSLPFTILNNIILQRFIYSERYYQYIMEREIYNYLIFKFCTWQPLPPLVVNKSKYYVTLKWMENEPFNFLQDDLLYRLERKEKIPPWVVIYQGGKTEIKVVNLAPNFPHKFRLKIIMKPHSLPYLVEKTMRFFGAIENIYKNFELNTTGIEDDLNVNKPKNSHNQETEPDENKIILNNCEKSEIDKNLIVFTDNIPFDEHHYRKYSSTKFLESQWSEVTSTSTESDGTSVVCFCMAVRCGYLKQVQIMLEERPELIELVNPTNGFAALATAVRKGDKSMANYLIISGADVNQQTSTGQSPLHLAVLGGNLAIAQLLIDKGANLNARDINGLQIEHYAVDSGNLEMLQMIMDKGDVNVKDNNAWTPLFRAICQGSPASLLEELVSRGSDLNAIDSAGLCVSTVARLLKNRHGRSRDSVLRLVDTQYPHEIAFANFTRLTKKITGVQTLYR